MRLFTKKLFFLFVLTAWGSSYAQYSINALGSPQNIDFSGFDGSGFSSTPAAGQLNSNEWEITGCSDGDLLFGQTNTAGDYARGTSTGGTSSGGFYSFDNGTGASLGFQGTGGDLTPGTITLAINNNTGSTIENLDLSYEVWVYNDQGRANSFNFDHGSDNVNFTAESSLDFISTEVADNSPAWVSETRTITLTGLNIADGNDYYLRWSTDDVSGGGSRDEIAIDNIELTGLAAGPSVIASPALLTGFVQFIGNPSAEQSFDVSGNNLTSDITITVTAGDYQISETSGGTFGNTVTLTQTAGVVASTPIYVVLDGSAVANPSNGTITITSTNATPVEVTLEGQILNPDPTVFGTPGSLSGFTHFVGTPSAEQTIEVSGEFLTNDLIVTAPGDYEVSLSSGAGFAGSVSLTPSSGVVPNTTVYVRLNGAAQNYSNNGDIVVSSTNATDVNISLEGETLDYTLYPIGSVTTNDNDGIVDSLDVYVELRGIVHCFDNDGNDGYSFVIIDGAGDGINVFNFDDVNSYVVTEGDSIGVKGFIDQFNGLSQVFAEEITVFNQGNATVTPTIVTALDETTESQLVTLEGLTLVNGEMNWPTNGNIDVTNGTDIFTVRVVSASPLSGEPTPAGAFDITGTGGQFDNSLPYDEGYQLFPCDVNELCNLDETVSVNGLTIAAVQTGVDYQWVDCDDNFSPITGATSQTYEATQNGNYAVILTDGACSDTSDCVEISTVGTTTNDLNAKIKLFPNPIVNQFNIEAGEEKIVAVRVYSSTGKLIFTSSFDSSAVAINAKAWEKGVYFVKTSTRNGTVTLKVVK
jgi:hypothetical protein